MIRADHHVRLYEGTARAKAVFRPLAIKLLRDADDQSTDCFNCRKLVFGKVCTVGMVCVISYDCWYVTIHY